MFDYRFVDRDIFMRYLGNGIGHRATNHIPSSQSCNTNPEVAVDDSEDSGLNEFQRADISDGTESEALSDEDDDYGYNHNKLMEKELESDEAGEDEDEH